MSFNNKTLERDLPQIKETPTLGTVGGASIEVGYTSYIYNGVGAIDKRDRDIVKLLVHLNNIKNDYLG